MEYLRNLLQSSTAGHGSNQALWRRSSLDVVVMGAGSLGQSLTCLPSFSQQGFRIVGLFDSDPHKIGTIWNGIVVESPELLGTRVQQEGVFRAIIAVSPPEAQEVADRLVEAGIRQILNYAPVNLRVPRAVVCERIDPVHRFFSLSLPEPNLTSSILEEDRPASLYDTLMEPGSTLGVIETKEGPSRSGHHKPAAKASFSPLRGALLAFPLYVEVSQAVSEKLRRHHQSTQSQSDKGATSLGNADLGVSFFAFLQREREILETLDKEQTSKEALVHSVPVEYPSHLAQQDCSARSQGGPCEASEYPCTPPPPGTLSDHVAIPSEARPASAPPSVRASVSPRVLSLSGLEIEQSELKASLDSSSGEFLFSGVLLFGPPGSGKTALLQDVVLSPQSEHAILTRSAGDLTKSAEITQLFNCARASAINKRTTVICIESIDILCKSDGLKLALLAELDLIPTNVQLIATTNLPWEVDMSVLRHFERRIAVPLPGLDAREQLLVREIVSRDLPLPAPEKVQRWSRMTQGYSACDIVLVVKDAVSRARVGGKALDFERSIKHIKPSISNEISSLYTTFTARFGHQSPALRPQKVRLQPTYLSLYS
mmetsp:Transcript_13667/g.24357  ORF Transcript_13667/g.24357 Transcript_13667/m.24357 type:complete len:599 (+) Transcript_13667:260-2056(+)